MAHDLPTTGILSYLYQRTPTHWHRGIDLPAREGTPVHAAAPGTVTHAVREYTDGFGGYGRVVAIAAHDGTHQLYAHLQHVGVQAGQKVHAGDVIGTVGRTGFTAAEPHKLIGGAHLHFEVSPRRYPLVKEAERVDPVAWLLRGNVHPLKAYRFAPPGAPTTPTDRGGDPSGPPSSSGSPQASARQNVQLEQHVRPLILGAIGFVLGVALLSQLR